MQTNGMISNSILIYPASFGEKVWDMLCCEDGLGGTAADGKPFYISMNNLRIDDRETGFQILKIEH